MRKFLISVLLYTLITGQSIAAQAEVSKNVKYSVNSSSEFIFESYPNQELIPIRLLGAIKNAGLYHIPANMKLTTLLSLAGGTTQEADLENILIGNDQKADSKSTTIDLEDVLKKGAKNDYTLNANDIVLIKNKSPMISNDSFRMISIVSVLLTTILTAVIIHDRTK